MTQTSGNAGGPPPVAGKRPAPPKVAAVTLEGVRYEQARLSRSEAGNGQRCGFLAAYKGDTDERLWVLQVYAISIDPNLEGDVQEVYFSRMEAAPGGQELVIENERRERFAVDLRSRSVRPLP